MDIQYRRLKVELSKRMPHNLYVSHAWIFLHKTNVITGIRIDENHEDYKAVLAWFMGDLLGGDDEN